MAVIPEALVNPEAGLNLLKLGADGKNAGGGIFIAMLFTVPEFAKAQGTMVDKYKAFIGNTDAVNSVCRSRSRPTPAAKAPCRLPIRRGPASK